MTRNDKMKSPGQIMAMWVCFGIFIILLTGMGNGRK
jgi:hypothetical protein